VLFMDASGDFGQAAANGAGVKPLPSLGTHGNDVYAVPSPDNRYVMVSDGAILAVNGSNASLESKHIPIGPSDLVGGFADDDQYALVVNPGSNLDNPIARVSLVDRRTGGATYLGVSEATGADPQTAGVFAAVPGPATRSGDTTSLIQLRQIGRPTTTLVTAASINRDLGEAANTPIVLNPMPDDNGDEIAVTVNRPSSPNDQSVPTDPSVGVVVLSRRGQLISSLRGGPLAGFGVSWSPDGQSIAYLAPAGAFSDIDVWTLSAGRPLVRLVTSGDEPSGCIWSTGGSQILCETIDGSTGVIIWLTARAGGGPIESADGPGDAITWTAP
jgi:WD40 repeat protein